MATTLSRRSLLFSSLIRKKPKKHIWRVTLLPGSFDFNTVMKLDFYCSVMTGRHSISFQVASKATV